jgi:phosphoglycolate phosphatase
MSAIFFDLDGTLTDSKPGITRSIQYALDKLGHDVPSEDDLTSYIGGGLLDCFEELTGDRQLSVTAVRLFRERYADVGLFENSVYPKIHETLEALNTSGHRLFIATSKLSVSAQRIVEHFGLAGSFDRVFGSELDGTLADKTELLRHALRETGVSSREAIMIGDRMYDMIGARKNEMTAVGVLYGYGDRDELIAAGAHHISATPLELLGIVT